MIAKLEWTQSTAKQNKDPQTMREIVSMIRNLESRVLFPIRILKYVQLANFLERGPLMWKMLIYMHVNQNMMMMMMMMLMMI